MKNISLYISVLLACISLFSCSDDSEDSQNSDFDIRIELSNENPAIGELVEVKAIISSGEIEKAEWTWGNENTSEGIDATHSFEAEGNYVISLKVTNSLGENKTTSAKVKVEGVGLTKKISESDNEKVWITAHRGNTGNDKIPENSMAALEACISGREYLDFVEIDPRMTKDGVIVLMHDPTVDRTTTGTGEIANLTYAEVQQLKLKLDDGTVTNERIPTLQDFLLEARGKVYINLDFIDKVSPKEIFDLVKTCGMQDQVLFTVGTKKEVYETMLGYSNTIHLLGQYSNEGDEDLISSVGGGNRIKFTYITPAKALSTDFAELLWDLKFIPATNVLDQNGFYYDTQIVNGDFTGIDKLLAKNFLLLQTDHPKILHDYLSQKGKR